jgi:FkbM family methyltransferase
MDMRLAGNLIKLLSILEQPGAFNQLVKSRVFSVSSYQINAALSQYQSTFNTIIDIGANCGQFAAAAAHRFPMARIYSFEPVPDVFEKLKQNVKDQPQIQAFNYAVGNNTGKTRFHRHQYTQASSALTLHRDNNHPYFNQDDVTLIEVELVRLDDIMTQLELAPPVLLKMDVQGYEKEVLDGAQILIRMVDHIALETSLVQLYNDQPLFDEMHAYIKERGFEFVAPLDIHKGRDLTIVEMDVLYSRAV